jgi:hypothetical protein
MVVGVYYVDEHDEWLCLYRRIRLRPWWWWWMRRARSSQGESPGHLERGSEA